MSQGAAAHVLEPEEGIRQGVREDARKNTRSQALGEIRAALPEALRGQVRSAKELSRRRRRERSEDPFPIALAPLDRLLDGGLPRGRLVELVGRRSSGRLSTLFAMLAAVTATGRAAALVDLGDSLDPQAAVDAGIDLERLLWVRPRRTRDALAAAEILLEGGFPLVAMDLGQPPVSGGRGVEAGWLRLVRQARDRRAALLVSAPYRVSGTAAATVIATTRERTAWCREQNAKPLLAGLHADLVREKHRGSAPGMQEALAFHTATPWATGHLAPREARPALSAVPKPVLLPFVRPSFRPRREASSPIPVEPETLDVLAAGG